MSEDDTDLPVEAAPENKSSLLAKLRIAGLVIAAALVLIVISRNWDLVTIDLFTKEVDLPQSMLVVLTFLFGVAVGLLLGFIRPWRKKKE
ncbi:MAG: LapA family protein [Roseibacillus sp.]